MTALPMLTVEGLEVVYQRSITALHGVTFQVSSGQIAAMLGANGAGKTTTLRAISGFIGLDNARVTKGTIRYKNEPLENRPPNTITQLGIVLIPERDKVFPNLSVAENLTAVRSKRISAQEHRRLEHLVYDAFPRLAGLRQKEAGLLSGGERQMLAVGAAITCGPELMLIDELSLGLAPVIVEDLVSRLLKVRQELGITILLVEQSATVALRMADYAYVLENGRVVMQGSAEELRRNEDIQKFYLGTAAGERRSYREAAAGRRSRSLHG